MWQNVASKCGWKADTYSLRRSTTTGWNSFGGDLYWTYHISRTSLEGKYALWSRKWSSSMQVFTLEPPQSCDCTTPLAEWECGLSHRCLASGATVTGGRPLLTQQANWEFFESFSTIYSDDTQWVNCELIQNLPTTLIKLWSVGKFWIYPQKAHQFAHEVLLWKNSESSFTNFPEYAHYIPWATHQEFFQKLHRTCSVTYPLGLF